MNTIIQSSNIYHHKHQRFTGNEALPERKMKMESVRAQKTEISQGATATTERMNKSAQVNFGGFFNAKLGEKISQNKLWHKILKAPGKNSGVFESSFALLITCLLRPAAIMATPGSKKEDKQAASVQSILSGVVDFTMTGIILKPVDKAISKVHKELEKDASKLKYVDKEHMSKALGNMDFIFNYGTKSSLIPLRSFLTIALIPPTVKLLFPNYKTKKEKEQEKLAKLQNQTTDNYFKGRNQVNNEVFANFLGDKK